MRHNEWLKCVQRRVDSADRHATTHQDIVAILRIMDTVVEASRFVRDVKRRVNFVASSDDVTSCSYNKIINFKKKSQNSKGIKEIACTQNIFG